MDMNRKDLSLLVTAVIVALAVRLAPALYRVDMIFDGYDEYYHLRRISYTFEHFPHTLWFDSYIDYPHGLGITWPPLFDILVAALAHLMTPFFHEGSVEFAAWIISPFLGGLLVICIYAIARALFDRNIALVSAFILALNPYNVLWTSVGSPDHHSLEILLFSAIVLFMIYSMEGENRYLWSVCSGTTIAALAYTWAGAPIYLSLIPAFSLLKGISAVREKRRADHRPVLISLIVACVLTAPFAFSNWLYISFLAIVIITIFVLLIAIAERVLIDRDLPVLLMPLIIAAFAMVVLFIYHNRLYGYILYLVGGVMTGKIAEAEPIFVNINPFSPVVLWLLLCLLGLYVLASERARGEWKNGRLLLLIWCALALVLTIGQKRFLYLSSTAGSLLLAILLLKAADRIKEYPSRRSLVGLLLALLIPLPLVELPSAVTSQPAISDGWIESLSWLKENTPRTSYFEEPSSTPEYGVMCWWDYGNWIVYLGERPVVANNFQTGVWDASSFFLSEDERKAISIMDRRRARYVITDLVMIYGKLPALCSWIGEDPSSYQEVRSEDGIIRVRNLEGFNRTILAGLHLNDCSYLEHFRLIHESRSFAAPYGAKPSAMIKIFEYVPGALIKGRARDGRIVIAVLNLSSNLGRPFQYVNYALSINGSYEIRVPYSTDGSYGIKAEGPYQIVELLPATDGWSDVHLLNISEEDVLEGRTIYL